MAALRFLVLTTILTLSFSSYAQSTLSAGAKAAITETKQAIDALRDMHVQSRLRSVVSGIVENGTLALAEAGQINEANRIRREWAIVESKIFGSNEALGDHRPLSQWLAGVYKSIERVLGKARMEALHLDDIYVVNYAVPVSVTPKSGWSKKEYSLHFVPFTGVVVYWSSLSACLSAFQNLPYLRPYCSRISSILEARIASDVAPMLSNFVFDKFNSRYSHEQFNISEQELVRHYGAELSRIR